MQHERTRVSAANGTGRRRLAVLGLVIAVAALAVGVLCWLAGGSGRQAPGSDEDGERPSTRAAGSAHVRRAAASQAKNRAATVRPPKVSREKPVLSFDDDDSDRSPEDRQLAKDIERALDEEDFALARRCAAQALKSKDREIRDEMVSTLGWFGEKAIPELTPFIADPDDEIAESAMDEWSMAVSGIEDDGVKIEMVEMAMQVITDEDSLETIADEYIGVDEALAVGSLLRVIEGGGSAAGIAKAKETYEFVTGDEFVDRATAEKWVAEEYQPDLDE